ncbi:MAG: DNA polymerase III subunit delta, partial [Verrucomicrobiota bacterium]|nr:DNA polymerase III subunit delta [Verrucomicrobiota bacterium]
MSSNSLYAVLGDDDYLVRQRAKEVFDELCPEFPDDLSREIIDGRADRVDEVERILSEARSAGETLSLFGGGKLVWINEANFLNQTKTGAAQGSKEALEAFKPFLENLGETKLIFSACPVHRSHAFVKWLQKNAIYEDVAKNEKEDVAFRRLVQDTAKEFGVRFSNGALEYLAGKIGAHSRLGVEETKKLASYLGKDGGEITEEMVIDMVPDFGEGDFFEASEAFFSGKLDWAIDAIDRHFFQGKDARPLLATLQNRNRLLIQLRVLVDGKELDPNQRLSKDQLERIGKKYQDHFSDSNEKSTLNLFSQNPWFLGRLLPLVRKFS